MPAPKLKLHKSTGKLKILPRSTISASSARNVNVNTPVPVPSTSTGTGTTSEGSTENNNQQFEVELYWCIQQLEASLNSGKLNPKQAADTEKSLKILKSNSQPLIKKRILMKNAFGDYRSKMAEEERKMASVNRQIKFDTTNPIGKSHFVKKSAVLSLGKEFKFNFPEEQLRNLSLHAGDNQNDAEKPSESSSEKITSAKFAPSDNSFRFNFNVEEKQLN